jgi:hypothetical protein
VSFIPPERFAELSRVLAIDLKLTIAGFRKYAHFEAPEVLAALPRRCAAEHSKM